MNKSSRQSKVGQRPIEVVLTFVLAVMVKFNAVRDAPEGCVLQQFHL